MSRFMFYWLFVLFLSFSDVFQWHIYNFLNNINLKYLSILFLYRVLPFIVQYVLISTYWCRPSPISLIIHSFLTQLVISNNQTFGKTSTIEKSQNGLLKPANNDSFVPMKNSQCPFGCSPFLCWSPRLQYPHGIEAPKLDLKKTFLCKRPKGWLAELKSVYWATLRSYELFWLFCSCRIGGHVP